jgi:hypothetical protein
MLPGNQRVVEMVDMGAVAQQQEAAGASAAQPP